MYLFLSKFILKVLYFLYVSRLFCVCISTFILFSFSLLLIKSLTDCFCWQVSPAEYQSEKILSYFLSLISFQHQTVLGFKVSFLWAMQMFLSSKGLEVNFMVVLLTKNLFFEICCMTAPADVIPCLSNSLVCRLNFMGVFCLNLIWAVRSHVSFTVFGDLNLRFKFGTAYIGGWGFCFTLIHLKLF